jgi:hypothetical protein
MPEIFSQIMASQLLSLMITAILRDYFIYSCLYFIAAALRFR